MTDIEKDLHKEVNELRTNPKVLQKKQKKINNISKIKVKSINIQMIKMELKQKKVPKPMMKPSTF